VNRQQLTIRFSGDSGDGVQLIGKRFSVLLIQKNYQAKTLAEYPSEIRAPIGSIEGVSNFQLQFGQDIHTHGHMLDILIVLNPASLAVNTKLLTKNSWIIANTDGFNERFLAKVGYKTNPLESTNPLCKIYPIALVKLLKRSLQPQKFPLYQIERSKNFVMFGVVCRLLNLPISSIESWIQQKFSKNSDIVQINQTALKVGWNFAGATEIFPYSISIEKNIVPLKPGVYRYVNGNTATAYALIAAAKKAGLHLFFGGYPITPASGIFQELAKYTMYNLTTWQAEDEIAAIGAAIGAAKAGALAATATSGPGMALKGEFINLAVMIEIPLLIINVQRVGPSTGLPTKTEQSDLLHALWGRPGESPVVVMAISSPSDSFDVIMQAAHIAFQYMTPVILLSDSYLADSLELWRIPEDSEMRDVLPPPPPHLSHDGSYHPYKRNPRTLAPNWARVGTPGFECCVGGLEKEDVTGRLSGDPTNHEKMIQIRHRKIQKVQQEIDVLQLFGNEEGWLLVIGWGSSFSAIREAVTHLYQKSYSIAHLHLRFLNPLPKDLLSIIKKFQKTVVIENNLGQLLKILSMNFSIPMDGFYEMKGQTFITENIKKHLLEQFDKIS